MHANESGSLLTLEAEVRPYLVNMDRAAQTARIGVLLDSNLGSIR